jgi:hypothetical protein
MLTVLASPVQPSSIPVAMLVDRLGWLCCRRLYASAVKLVAIGSGTGVSWKRSVCAASDHAVFVA